jgi:hypothetical protein
MIIINKNDIMEALRLDNPDANHKISQAFIFFHKGSVYFYFWESARFPEVLYVLADEHLTSVSKNDAGKLLGELAFDPRVALFSPDYQVAANGRLLRSSGREWGHSKFESGDSVFKVEKTKNYVKLERQPRFGQSGLPCAVKQVIFRPSGIVFRYSSCAG